MKQFFTTILASFFWLSLAGQGPAIPPPFGQTGDQWVDSIMNQLSPKERIGQLFHVAAYSNRGSEHEAEIHKLIKEYGIGGLIFFQGGPVRQARQCNAYQESAKVPLMISMDAEWGIGMRLDSTISFPYQMTLGAVQDNQLIYQMGQEIARQFQLLGMHVNFAPVLDVNNNPANPVINYRAFGENKYDVTAKGFAYTKGMQEAQILATGKHFPGHGDTGVDSHHELPLIAHNRNRLDTLELFPFQSVMKLGLGGIMVAHLSIPALDSSKNLPSTLSKPIVTDLLKKEMGFEGLVFTDALNMKGVTKYYAPGRVDVLAIIAGHDALVFPLDVAKGVRQIEAAIEAGELSQEEIDARCRKTLYAKYWAGLNQYKAIAEQGLIDSLNTAKAQLLDRKLTEASLTVLNNQDNCLPIKDLANTKILAISIAKDAAKSHFQSMLSKYTKVDVAYLNPKANQDAISTLEKKVAEYDYVILGLHQLLNRPKNILAYNDQTLQFISKMAQSGKVVMSLFRNPYLLDKIPNIEKAQALIVAYQGTRLSEELCAQLIFGGIGANGKLPVTVNATYPYGAGMELEGGTRLKYSIPEEVNWDGNSLEYKLDSIIHIGLENEAYPGCQILVAKSNTVIFHKTYGYHNYEKKRPVQIEDIYDFASVTKITGPLPALMKLVDEDKFVLDTSFQTYWPSFKNSNKADLQWREILAHQARLQAWIPYWESTVNKKGAFKRNTFKPDSSAKYSVRVGNSLYMNAAYRKKMYKAIKKSPLRENDDYLYSGLSFYLYPEIIENLSGQDYEQYCKENFYKPLGAHTITWNAWQHYPLSQVIPTEKDTFFRKELLHGFVHDEGAAMMGGVSGNAGLFGSTNDLAKLMTMYLNMGQYGGHQYISSQTMTEFTAYQYKENDNRRGLGFDKPMLSEPEKGYVAPAASPSSFGHSGYTGTFCWADPERELLLVFMSNRVHPTRLNRKLYTLNIRPSLHQVLYDADSLNHN